LLVANSVRTPAAQGVDGLAHVPDRLAGEPDHAIEVDDPGALVRCGDAAAVATWRRLAGAATTARE